MSKTVEQIDAQANEVIATLKDQFRPVIAEFQRGVQSVASDIEESEIPTHIGIAILTKLMKSVETELEALVKEFDD